MQSLIPPESEITRTDEIAESLITVETLYIIASNPVSLRELTGRLKTNFGMNVSADQVNQVLENLVEGRMIRKFVNIPGNGTAETGLEAFSITPLGLSRLSKWLESLSEITLTMQLGLNQRLASAEE